MALTVGELTASITIDNSAVDPGLRQAEQAMRRTGQRMGDDAERAGRQAGQNLGDGLTDGADRAGRQAGDALGAGLADSGGQGADQAVGTMGDRLGQLKMAAAGVGVAAGAALMAAFGEALNQGQITARLRAQLGATGPEAKRYGEVAGQLFAQGITGDFQTAADSIRAVVSAGLAPPEATNAQLQSIATKAADVASTFDEDLGGVTNAVSQLMRTGLAKNASEAFDIVTKGMSSGADKAGDFLDTINEYPTQFRRLGIDGQTATGLLSQGLQKGARDADQVADALGQFGERALAGGTAVEEAYSSIGLNADDMAARIGKGGKSAEQALQMTLDALRGTKDEQVKLNAAAALFGDPANVMGEALYALNPATAAAATGMDKAKGSTDELGNSLRDNAGSRLTAFKNSMQQNLVDFLGNTVIPAVDGFRSKVGGVFGKLWEDAGKGSDGTADQIISFIGGLGQKIAAKLVEEAPKALEGLLDFGGKIADFIIANPGKVLKIAAIAAAITLAIVALPITVGAALSLAVGVMIAGFVRNLVTGLTENLPKWWQAFTDWISTKATEAGTMFSSVGSAIGSWFGGLWSQYISGPVGRAWSSFIGGVRALPGRAVSGLTALGSTLSAKATSAWQSFKDAASRKGTEFITWVTGLPKRAKSALGDLGTYLAGAGRSLIQGFINGIKNMIKSVRSAASGVVSAAREYFPFSPAKKGPFSGRGYTTYSGQALMAGFAKGIRDSRGQVGRALDGMPGMPDAMADASLGTLAATPTPSQAAYGSSGAGSARPQKIVWEVKTGGTQMDDLLGGLIREFVSVRGGDVQQALGNDR